MTLSLLSFKTHVFSKWHIFFLFYGARPCKFHCNCMGTWWKNFKSRRKTWAWGNVSDQFLLVRCLSSCSSITSLLPLLSPIQIHKLWCPNNTSHMTLKSYETSLALLVFFSPFFGRGGETALLLVIVENFIRISTYQPTNQGRSCMGSNSAIIREVLSFSWFSIHQCIFVNHKPTSSMPSSTLASMWLYE